MLGVESDSLLQTEASRSSRKLIFLSVGVALFAIILGISISAIVLSVKALQDKKVEDKVDGCYYKSSSNNYTVPNKNPGYASGVTVIRGGTVWTGTGQLYNNYDIAMVDGKITAIGPSPLNDLPSEAIIYNVNGAFVTPGDMHSHAGVYALPEDAHGTSDGNEATDPTTPQLRTIDAIDPDDPAIPLILSGGVTTSLILPGSANLIGGEAYPVKMKGGSVANMSIPGTTRYFKMAAGENPKNVYGDQGVLPSTRMGNISLKDIQKTGEAQQGKRPFSAKLEPLVAILRGEALINIHCYEVQDFEAILRIADEFGFKVAAFHHALEAYKIPYVFAARNITIATFSDHWGFKMEGYDASVNSPSILTQNGVKVALKSDHPVLFAKFLSLEAVKAHHYGLSVDDALMAITAIPANALGLGGRVGTLEVGTDGDVVVWDKHPLVLGARPTKVFLEGQLKVDNPSPNPPSITPPTFATKSLVSSANACSAPTGSYYVQGGTMYTMNDFKMTSNPVVVVTNGIISCVGDTDSCTIPQGINSYSLDGGFIIPGIISAASTVGMNEIDQEALSGDGYAPIDNGANILAADGIRLEGRKVWATWAGGVTVQIAKPEASSLISGVSAAFYTHGTITNDALLVEKLALHITVGNNAKLTTQTSSVSGQFAMLRSIFKASTAGADPTDPVYQVLNGTLPVVFNVDQADEIGAVLRLVRDFKLTNVTIVGAAEAAVIAPQLQAAGVSVVLAPVQAYPATFETKRASDQAPAILVNAGVNLGVAEFDAGSTRNLRWNAGYAMSHGLNYTQALASITSNLARAYNLPYGTGSITVGTKANFVLYDGDPLVTGSKVAAVALGSFVQCNPLQF